MLELSSKKCIPCEGGVPTLDKASAEKLLTSLHADWQLDDNNKQITRTVKFRGFLQTMAFVNALAWIANQEMHHPDFNVTFNSCTIHFTTHAIDGLSENDFICASKVDKLLA